MKTNTNFTIEDAVRFIVLNRSRGRVKTFEDWTRDQIAFAIRRAVGCNGFAYATSGDNSKIVGVVLATPDHESNTLRIHHCLGETGSLRALIKAFRSMYEGYRVTARRRGKEVEYRTPRLVQLAERN